MLSSASGITSQAANCLARPLSFGVSTTEVCFSDVSVSPLRRFAGKPHFRAQTASQVAMLSVFSLYCSELNCRNVGGMLYDAPKCNTVMSFDGIELFVELNTDESLIRWEGDQ